MIKCPVTNPVYFVDARFVIELHDFSWAGEKEPTFVLHDTVDDVLVEAVASEDPRVAWKVVFGAARARAKSVNVH